MIEKTPVGIKARIALFFAKKAHCFFNVLDWIAIHRARRSQKKIINDLRSRDKSTLNDYEIKTAQRNFYIDKIQATYTITKSNTLIITRNVYLMVFEDGDLIYRFQVKCDNYILPPTPKGILNKLDRFNKLSFAYSLLDSSRKSNKKQKINCKPSVNTKENKFTADIIIKSCQKGQKITLSMSMSLPNEINPNDEYPIKTVFTTPAGVWEFEFQEEIYGNKKSRFTANIEDDKKKVYFPFSYKSIYYETHRWKIRHSLLSEESRKIFRIRSI